jgi:plasmid stabilization system protein ParE
VNVFYTPEANNDLQRLRTFIAGKNPAAAQQIAADLLAGIAILKELPYNRHTKRTALYWTKGRKST